MKFGSVCSGIEAASVAWHPLGWRAAWLAEIEPAPAAVLAHHYPDVPNLGDMTKIAARVAAGEVDAPDVLVGGTPCQAFSVAGLRGGLSDARGQLTLAYVELANAIDAARAVRGERPAVIVWENVPGVLSSKDNAFGCFLGALAGEDCELKPPGKRWADAGCVFGPQRAIAWRVLDAQYFELAQRRRRVFVVASARAGFDPSTVLFEFEGVRRDSPPSREPQQDPAAGTSYGISPDCFDRSGEAATGTAADRSGLGIDTELAYALRAKRAGGVAAPSGVTEFLPQSSRVYLSDGVSPALQAAGARMGNRAPQVLAYGGNNQSGPIDVATACRAKGGSGHGDFESETFVVQPPVMAFQERGRAGGRNLEIGGDLAFALTAPNGGGRAQERNVLAPVPLLEVGKRAGPAADDPRAGMGIGNPGDPMFTLQAGAQHGVVAFSCKDHGADAAADIAPTLRAMGHSGSHPNAGGQVAICYGLTTEQTPKFNEDCALTLTKQSPTGGGQPQAVAYGFNARQDPDAWTERTGPLDTDGSTQAVCVTGDVTHTLRAEGFDASEDGTGRGNPIVAAYAFQPRIARNGRGDMGDLVNALTAQAGETGKGDAAPCVAVAIHENQRAELTLNDTAGAIKCAGGKPGQGYPAAMVGMAVRRLTPVECERLQGFPDGYTQVPYRGKPMADGPRYKMLGNSMATRCMFWIGARIDRALRSHGILKSD